MFWKVFTIVIAVLLGGSIGPSRQPHDVERNGPSTLPSIPHPDLTKATPCPVISIADGDTVTILKDGKSETVRLLGVDTPETKDPRKPVEFFGREAAAFTTNLLTGESVYVVEEQPGKRDKYGRVLAHLYRAPDGLWVNLEIVRQGYGVAYSGEAFQDIDLFLKYQAHARESGKGLWSPIRKDEWERDRQVFPIPAPTTSPVAPAAQPTGEDPKPQTQQVTVYVTRSGTKYHAAGCSYLKSSAIPMSLDEARKRYGPCSKCGPPR